MVYWKGEPSPADVADLQSDMAIEQAKPIAVLMAGLQNVGATVADRRLTWGWEVATADTNVKYLSFARNVVIKNMTAVHNQTVGDGDPVAYTLYKGAVGATAATSLVCSVASDSAGPVSDTSNEVAVTAGEVIEILAVIAADITNGGLQPQVTIEVHAA